MLEVASSDVVGLEGVITEEFESNCAELEADDCCTVELGIDIIEDTG